MTTTFVPAPSGTSLWRVFADYSIEYVLVGWVLEGPLRECGEMDARARIGAPLVIDLDGHQLIQLDIDTAAFHELERHVIVLPGATEEMVKALTGGASVELRAGKPESPMPF